MLRRVFLNTKEVGARALGPTWTGPYNITEVLRLGTYKLATMGGLLILSAGNIDHLKKYTNKKLIFNFSYMFVYRKIKGF